MSLIITIGRQFGSGGRDVGEKVAEYFNIPFYDKELVELAGWYADRMSVNLELPTEAGLKELAPNKSRKNILTPMRQIQSGMAQSMEMLGMKGGNRSAYWYTSKRLGRSMEIEEHKITPDSSLIGGRNDRFEEQKKIGDYFRSLDHFITLHQQKCDELRNVKKFMLQNMFI